MQNVKAEGREWRAEDREQNAESGRHKAEGLRGRYRVMSLVSQYNYSNFREQPKSLRAIRPVREIRVKNPGVLRGITQRSLQHTNNKEPSPFLMRVSSQRLTVYCLLLTAYCLLITAYRLLVTERRHLASLPAS